LAAVSDAQAKDKGASNHTEAVKMIQARAARAPLPRRSRLLPVMREIRLSREFDAMISATSATPLRCAHHGGRRDQPARPRVQSMYQTREGRRIAHGADALSAAIRPRRAGRPY
jgi:hypothetical protein